MNSNSVPDNWVNIKTEEVFEQLPTSLKKVKTKSCMKEGTFPVIDQGQSAVAGYINDETKVININKPIVIFGDHTRVVKWVDYDFVPGADGTKVLEGKEYLIPKFFYYQISSLELPDKGYARHFKFLKESDFSVPPLAEQKQIATKLDQLISQVTTLKNRLDKIPTILKRFRQSVLAVAVSGKLTEEWRANIEMHVLEGISLPVSWNLKRASEACLKVQSGSTPKSKPFEQGGTVPFLKVYNIVDQQIDFNYKPQFVTKEVHMKSLKRSVAIPNDVLMNIVGPPLGKVALLTDQFPEWNLNQAITFFRSDPDQLLYKYMYYVLCEGALVRKVMPETKGSVGQINISLTQCRDFFIALPSLEEQKEIVYQVEKFFSYADQIEKQVNSAQTRVNNLTQSILAKAFRGELTAEWRQQNPDLISGENSAEALLEKIRIERESLKPAKKTKRKMTA